MLIQLKNIQKTYSSKSGVTFRALSNVSAQFDSKGLTFLVGQSGSGKSTLLNIIGGLDDFDSGELILGGRDVRSLKGAEVDSLRNTLMGFIFQEFNLIDTLSVYDNVKLSLEMQSDIDKQAVDRALEQMGIADKAHNKTKDLSGGQRQRVAIARALVKNPQIILADEPTGSLDSATSEEVFNILKELSKDRLVLVVTHDMDAAQKYGDRIIEMKDGKIYRDVRKKEAGEVVEQSDTVMYSDTLMLVPAGVKVSDKDVEKLNEVISSSARKTYVNVESDPKRIKAMFPQLREAVDSKNGADSDKSELDEGAFVPYQPKDEPTKEFEYKKSKLPILSAVRLSLNNLNHKKARLIFTIIIAFVAFVLFGVAQSFTMYNENRAMATTIEQEGINKLTLESSLVSAERIPDSDIKSLEEAAPYSELYKKYVLSLPFPEGKSSAMNKFTGAIEIDDVSKLGYLMYAGSSVPEDYNSIIISRYAADQLMRSGIGYSLTGLIGRGVRLGARTYIITGIFDCDFEKYQNTYDENLQEEFAKKRENDWEPVYVKPGFMTDYAARIKNFDGTLFNASTNSASRYDSEQTTLFKLWSQFSEEDGEKIIPITTGVIEGDDQIIISRNLINGLRLTGDDKYVDQSEFVNVINEFNAKEDRQFVLRQGSNAVWVSNSVQIVGYIDDEASTLYVSDGIKFDIASAMYYPNLVFSYFEPTYDNAYGLIQALTENGFKIYEKFVTDYEFVLSLIVVLRNVLLGLAIALCLLVVLLVNSFISSSIKITRKQIGILRALGAKKSDTFKIYAAEGFIMTIISLVAAVLVLALAAPLLNTMLSSTFGYYFALISIGWEVYLTLAVLALVVTVISVALPLRKFNKITPVSAISGKDE